MIHNCNKIAILLSTYNGEKYLRSQLDSIINQDYCDWALFIRDDGSTDRTMEIVNEYIQFHDNIHHYIDDLGNIGACSSFMTMLENVDSSLYAFSDQDDVWLPYKLSRAVKAIQKIEEIVKDGVICYHSNVKVVDTTLNVLYDNYWAAYKLDNNKRFEAKFLMVSPAVLGMTMVFNHNSKKHMIPYRGAPLMHDSWCSIQAATNGILVSDSTPSVLYRQHGNNVSGIGKTEDRSYRNRIKNMKKIFLINYNKFKVVHRLYSVGLLKFILLKIELILGRTKIL